MVSPCSHRLKVKNRAIDTCMPLISLSYSSDIRQCQVYYIIADALQHLERRFCCISGEEKQTFFKEDI